MLSICAAFGEDSDFPLQRPCLALNWSYQARSLTLHLVAIIILPGGTADCHGRPLPTADTTQFLTGPEKLARGFAASALCAAAAKAEVNQAVSPARNILASRVEQLQTLGQGGQGITLMDSARTTDISSSSQPPFWYHTTTSPKYTSTLLDCSHCRAATCTCSL
jgi:hypothetical protein